MRQCSPIEQAKADLPLPQLMEQLGYGAHAKKSAKCPFHDDKSPSFGIFEVGGGWKWKCHSQCGTGDEIDFLAKAKGIDETTARREFLSMTGTQKAGYDWDKANTPTSQSSFVSAVQSWRGYSEDFILWLLAERHIGAQGNKVTFPIRDDTGSIVGAHIFKEGAPRPWYDEKGDTKVRPYIIGNLRKAKFVFVFESQWDALAFYERSGARDVEGAVIFATRGASNGAQIQNRIPADAYVYAFPQNDPDEKRNEEGKTPADIWLEKVITNAGKPVMVVATPAQYKDVNDWTRAGATKEELNAAVSAGRLIAPVIDAVEPSLADVFESALLTAPELVSMEIPPRAKMLGEFYHEADLGFIYAPRGGGKTWLAMLIAQARANGCHLGEWEAGEKLGKVLYVDGEMHAADSQGRAKMIGMDNPNLIWLHGDLLFDRTERTLNLGLREHQDAIMELCVRKGITEVILDNISSLVRGLKENDGDDWREGLLPWLLGLRRRKIGVILVHHAGRNGLMRGTSQREDHANWVIKITPVGDDDRQGAEFVTNFEKLRGDPKNCPPLKWKLSTNPVGLLHYQCDKHTSLEAFVAHVNAGISSATEIAELMDVKKGTVSKWAHKAEQEGCIRIDNGKYLPAA